MFNLYYQYDFTFRLTSFLYSVYPRSAVFPLNKKLVVSKSMFFAFMLPVLMARQLYQHIAK